MSMNNLKNLPAIAGAMAFLIIAGLIWNYTEVAKERNAIERDQIAAEDARRLRAECEKEVKEKFEAVDAWQELMEKSGKSQDEVVASIQFFARNKGVVDENNFFIDDDTLIQKCLDGKKWRTEHPN